MKLTKVIKENDLTIKDIENTSRSIEVLKGNLLEKLKEQSNLKKDLWNLFITKTNVTNSFYTLMSKLKETSSEFNISSEKIKDRIRCMVKTIDDSSFYTEIFEAKLCKLTEAKETLKCLRLEIKRKKLEKLKTILADQQNNLEIVRCFKRDADECNTYDNDIRNSQTNRISPITLTVDETILRVQ